MEWKTNGVGAGPRPARFTGPTLGRSETRPYKDRAFCLANLSGLAFSVSVLDLVLYHLLGGLPAADECRGPVVCD